MSPLRHLKVTDRYLLAGSWLDPVSINSSINQLQDQPIPVSINSSINQLQSPFAVSLFRASEEFQSYISKGIWRQGNRLFCKEFLCFNTMPCRHMPLLVHFWEFQPGCMCSGKNGQHTFCILAEQNSPPRAIVSSRRCGFNIVLCRRTSSRRATATGSRRPRPRSSPTTRLHYDVIWL